MGVMCLVCRHENSSDVDVCMVCGADLTLTCDACGASPPSGSRFCHQCGTRLDVSRPAKGAGDRRPAPRRSHQGERKHVTVLFADVKGSMTLLAHRDPEEATQILAPILETMIEAVHEYEGTVNQVMGDGIMALFGAPVSHEDHAIRACYAALRMQRSLARYGQQVLQARGSPVEVRIGLNSGEVIVGSIESDLRMDYTAVGETTHLAARMEQLATPGSVLLTSETVKLAGGHIEVRSLGRMPVRGFDAPIEVYELMGASAARSPLNGAAWRGLTRFVGRDGELEHLRAAAGRAAAGQGQVVGIGGEPGVGKTRLLYEFLRQPWTEGALILAASAVSYGRSTLYLPVIDLLQSYFKIDDRDATTVVREKVVEKVRTLGPALEPWQPDLLALLNVPVEDLAWPGLDPPQRRARIFEAITRLLFTESRERPVCVVVENLHWIDAETQAFLARLAESISSHRMLLLVTYRPEYRPPWRSTSHATELRVDPLSPDLSRELLQALVGSDPSLGPVKALLIDRTDGNPFFLEETVRNLVEIEAFAGTLRMYRLARPVSSIQVPGTVRAVIAARIDRLPFEEERLLQSAAVIGRRVDQDLLRAIVDIPDDRLRAGLAHLQAAGFLDESRRFPDVEYTFKHALTQDVAYGSLLHDRLRTLHGRIVDAIETLSPDRLAEQTERLAHHAFRGEVWPKAVEYLLRSGRRALFASATGEAVQFFEQALLALRRLPQTAETLQKVVTVRLNLRDALWSLGHIAQIREQLVEAAAMGQHLGDQRAVGWAASYECHYLWAVGELDAALEAGDRALAIATGLGDALLLAETELYRGIVFIAKGDCERATAVLTRARGFLGDIGTGKRSTANRVTAIRLLVLSFLTRSLAEQGHFAAGMACGEEGLRIAEPATTAFGLATALAGLGALHLRKAEPHIAIPLLERGLTVCRTYSVNSWLPTIGGLLGAAYAVTGRIDDGVSLLEEAVGFDRKMGIVATLSLWRTYLAAAYFQAGRTAEALAEARRALAECRARKEHGYEAIALSVFARILARHEPPDVEQAREHYLQALKIAEQRDMRPLMVGCFLGLAELHERGGPGASPFRDRAAALAAELGIAVAAVQSA